VGKQFRVISNQLTPDASNVTSSSLAVTQYLAVTLAHYGYTAQCSHNLASSLLFHKLLISPGYKKFHSRTKVLLLTVQL